MNNLNIMSCLLAAVLGVMVGMAQGAMSGCKNCVKMSKEEKSMFMTHSSTCMTQSRVEPRLITAMLNGELIEDEALKRHIYCVLLKCKIIGKDGKLQKAAILGKIAAKGDAKNATKALEACSDNTPGDTPEDIAWNLFRCGYDKKAVLFDYMPTNAPGGDNENN